MPEFSEEDLEISELPEREAMIVIINGFVGLGSLLGINIALGPQPHL